MGSTGAKSVDCRGIRITVERDVIRVTATEQIPPCLLRIEIDLFGVRLTGSVWNPAGHAYTVAPPLNQSIGLSRCDVRVMDGPFALCEYKGGQPFTAVQVGWAPCVACGDSKLYPGRMWVGHSRAGVDEWAECPECRGAAKTPRYKYTDPATGREIDYESQTRLVEVPA